MLSSPAGQRAVDGSYHGADRQPALDHTMAGPAISAHLKILADARFVLADRKGTSAYYRINEACVDCFPTAADLLMGKPHPGQPPPQP